MNDAFKKSWEKQKKLLQDNVKEELNFFKKPISLEVIVNGAILTLTTLSSLYLEKLKNSTSSNADNIDNYIKTSIDAAFIIKAASDSQSEDLLALINACQTAAPTDEDMVKSMATDFEQSVNSIKLDEYNKIKNDVEFFIFCLYFINWLIFMIIDAIKNSEIPSIHRTKYLQKLIRMFAAYMKQYMKKIGKEFNEVWDIIKSLATIDALIISVVGSSYYYLTNRKKSQQSSLDSANKFLTDNTCGNTIPLPSDIEVPISKLDDTKITDINVCDVQEEDEVPSSPIINEEVTCEVNTVIEENIDPTFVPDLITNAFIENKTKRTFSPSISLESHVTTSSIIATLDASIIYSPVEGFISKISNNKIYIRDISEYDQTDIEKTTTKLIDNYTKKFNIVEFIKKYNVYLVYPIMLSNPGIIPVNKFLGIQSQHTAYDTQQKNELANYNNKIQDITKYDNIKPYLENNAVDEIKIRIDKETKDFLKKIKNINDSAKETQYNTIPIPSDYVLFDYYMLLYTQLNTSPKLTEIENVLKGKIKEFADNRNTIEKSIKIDKLILMYDSLKIESAWIKTFLDDLWKQYENIDIENAAIHSYLAQLEQFSGYGVVEEDDIKYRTYALTDVENCSKGVDSIVKPNSSKDLYTYKYWLKYMSYVTLVGAADVLSWSTGLILPSGPVKLPVIYTPIIPIKTDYGVILIGMTICGIYVFPFITYNNMTLSSKSIIMPNIISIKDEINAIKMEIKNLKSTLTTKMIKPILQNIKDELAPVTDQIKTIRSDIKEHNTKKPANPKKHPVEYVNWLETYVGYNTKYVDLNAKKFKLQIKYKVLKDFSTTGKLNSVDEDSAIKKIDSTVKSVEKKLDKLDKLIDKIDKIISILPTALAPNSVNFGATLKNPKPVIEIKDDANANIDTSILDGIFEKHKKSKEDLMKKNFKPTTKNNLENYYKIIKSFMNIIVPIEPYPTYDRIGPTNLGFLKFAKVFVEKGAKTFGIPGQLPSP